MSSGASAANSPTLFSQAAEAASSIGEAASSTVAGIGTSLGNILGNSKPSGSMPSGPASGSVGGARFRNMRGRFLSGKKAARMTLKKREAHAKTVGTKAQVFHGTAKHTSGGLTRKDLMKTKKGRIVSKRKHAAGKKALRRLKAAGFSAKKGTFKLFRK